MRRMDRYSDDNTKISRSLKNQELYQDVVNNPKVTNITDVRNANAYEINTTSSSQPSRESYQRMRRYQDVESVPRVKKELDDFNHLYPKKENKIYDINSVLEEARKNRKDVDQLEEKRKLKYTSYNILSGINLEELMKYREEKKKRQATPEEEGIRELIDTIASKTLAGEIDKETTVDLLSDLMATSALDKVEAPDEIDEDEEEEDTTDEITVPDINIQEELEKHIDDTVNTSKVDKDFYTKSMDLSEEDFETGDEIAEGGLSIGAKLFFAILIIAILAAVGFFIYQRFF